jgi:hypothetical protein
MATALESMMVAIYRAGDQYNPNNLYMIGYNWSHWFNLVFGNAGSFMRTGVYHVAPPPQRPTILDSTDPEVMNSITYREAAAVHIDGILQAQRENRVSSSMMSHMFAMMTIKTDSYARDHMCRDAEYRSLIEKGDDPLGLWMVMKRTLTSCRIGQHIEEQVVAYNAFYNLTQGTASVTAYYEAFLGKLNWINETGQALPDEARKVWYFLHHLDKERYGEMLRYIQNGMLAKPRDLHEAYVTAYEFVLVSASGKTRRADDCLTAKAHITGVAVFRPDTGGTCEDVESKGTAMFLNAQRDNTDGRCSNAQPDSTTMPLTCETLELRHAGRESSPYSDDNYSNDLTSRECRSVFGSSENGCGGQSQGSNDLLLANGDAEALYNRVISGVKYCWDILLAVVLRATEPARILAGCAIAFVMAIMSQLGHCTATTGGTVYSYYSAFDKLECVRRIGRKSAEVGAYLRAFQSKVSHSESLHGCENGMIQTAGSASATYIACSATDSYSTRNQKWLFFPTALIAHLSSVIWMVLIGAYCLSYSCVALTYQGIIQRVFMDSAPKAANSKYTRRNLGQARVETGLHSSSSWLLRAIGMVSFLFCCIATPEVSVSLRISSTVEVLGGHAPGVVSGGVSTSIPVRGSENLLEGGSTLTSRRLENRGDWSRYNFPALKDSSPYSCIVGQWFLADEALPITKRVTAGKDVLDLPIIENVKLYDNCLENYCVDVGRVSIYSGSNANLTVDRTIQELLSNRSSCGSTLYCIVSSDQGKALQMTACVLARVNASDARRTIYYGVTNDVFVDSKERTPYPARIVVDIGPTGTVKDLFRRSEELAVVTADEVRSTQTDESQLLKGNDFVESTTVPPGNATRDFSKARSVRFNAEIGGAITGTVEVRGGDNLNLPNDEMRGEPSRYHHPTAEGSSRDNPVGAPWFPSEKGIAPGEKGWRRVRKAPDRLTYDAFAISEYLTKEVSELTDMKPSESVGARMLYRPSGSRTRVQQGRVKTCRERHMSAVIATADKVSSHCGLKAVDEPLHKELSGLPKVFSQVLLKGLYDTQRSSIICSEMFFRGQSFSAGTFDKLKSRLVAGGDLQNRSDGENERSCPVLSLVAKKGRKVWTADVGMTYLNLKIRKLVQMRIDKSLAQMFAEVFPDAYSLDSDSVTFGCCGFVESGKLWYDEALFNILDLLMTSIDDADIEWVVSELSKTCGTVTPNTRAVHSSLGQTFEFNSLGEVSLSTEGYIRYELDPSGVKGYLATLVLDLNNIDEKLHLLETSGQDDSHSLVMRLISMAQRARPNILTAIASLSRGCGISTSDVTGTYLNSSLDLKRMLCESELRVCGYVDVSFSVHHVMKSQIGSVISLGRGADVSSKQQLLMTKSSTESELVGLSDQFLQIIWTMNFFLAEDFVVGPARVFQVAPNTIALAAKGSCISARTLHIDIEYLFVTDRVDSQEVQIIYTATAEMRADILTKEFSGGMRAVLMGMEDVKSVGVKEKHHDT